MLLKEYKNPKIFWDEVCPQVRKEESKNGLMLGLSWNFISKPENCLYQSGLFSGSELIGALILSRYLSNYNLIVTPMSEKESVGILLKGFLNKGIKFNNLIGEVETAARYCEFLEQKGQKIKVHMRQGVYSCKKIIHPMTHLNFRLATLEDVKLMGEWTELFHAEAVPHDPPVDGISAATEKIKAKTIYVVEDNGKVVSCAARARDIGTSATVNFVFTPKALRGRGYASYVTAELTRLILGEGKKEVALYTDLSNPTSNKIYQKIGYEFVCESVHLGIE